MMSAGDEIGERLKLVGVTVIVLAVIGSVVFVDTQPSIGDAEDFLTENAQFDECEQRSSDTLNCYRAVDNGNSTFYIKEVFQVSSYNDSTAVRQRK